MTVHNVVAERLCFYTCLSVILVTGVCLADTPRTDIPPVTRLRSGRYASYCNAFLFLCMVTHKQQLLQFLCLGKFLFDNEACLCSGSTKQKSDCNDEHLRTATKGNFLPSTNTQPLRQLQTIKVNMDNVKG